MMSISVATAQFGDPVFIQTFGEGNMDPGTIGPAIPAGKTDFIYDPELCPQPGTYTLVRRMNIKGCFAGEWIPLSHDQSPTDFGMMMLVNNTSSTTNRVVYRDTVSGTFCNTTIYHYSFAVINVDNRSDCQYGPDFPVFEYRVEDDKGNLIKKDTTRPGVGYSPADQYPFSTYSFDFNVPAGVTKIVPKLTLIHSTYWCAEDFAVDDIQIRPLGPKVKITFDNEPPETFVKSVCYQQNATISISGIMDPFYATPALQWQQSVDSGATWINIPGATTNTYSNTYSTPDTVFFRLAGADLTNIDNSNCRVVSNTLIIHVDGIPTGLSVINNSPVCAGKDLEFKAEGGASYLWSGPNGFHDNIPFPHIFNSVLEDSGTYYVQITTLGGCTAMDSTHVIMIGTNVKAGPDSTICNGSSISLHASTGTSYSWTPATGVSNTTIQNPKVTPAATTIYTVEVTSPDGCSDTAKATIKVLNNIPVKAAFSNTEYICAPTDTASFKDLSTGKIQSWQWNFGNGQTSNKQDAPLQYYYVSGIEKNFLVTLKVADSTGCADSALHLVKVAANCFIAVPSAFTPNNDGHNDYLYPLNAYKATNLIFRVYNRYGQLMFETKDWSRKWDGNVNSQPQPPGVYVWILEYNDVANKRISLRGTTVLIR